MVIDLRTRQVRLYFGYSTRVRVLENESIDQVEVILLQWLRNEDWDTAITARVHHPSESVPGRWDVEYTWDRNSLLALYSQTQR
jgi:hypothetical protein